MVHPTPIPFVSSYLTPYIGGEGGSSTLHLSSRIADIGRGGQAPAGAPLDPPLHV